MGTRADFYLKTGNTPQLIQEDWLGSIAWDGYPSGDPSGVAQARTQEEFWAAVAELAATVDHWTAYQDGWPWPWEDSRTTDFAYVWDGSAVAIYSFGRPYVEDKDGDEIYDPDVPQVGIFPDMRSMANVQLGGKKSGLIVISVGSDGRMKAE